MAEDKRDYYDVLEINPHADRRAIADAYDRLSRRYQPDDEAPPADPGRMRELDEAFDVLDDPARRAEYDRLRAARAVATETAAEAGERERGEPEPVKPPLPRRFWLGLGLLSAGVAAASAGLAVFALLLLTGGGERTVTLASGLAYTEIEEGFGELPHPGDAMTVHYTGNLADGTEFDSSRDGNPFVFFLGVGDVIPGWDEGLATIKEGGRRKLTIPPDLAYGEGGVPPVIPANATLVFDVEVLEIEGAGIEVTTESGLKYIDIEIGRDPQSFQAITPVAGNQVVVDIAGETADGMRFADTVADGQPRAFVLGSGSETAGLDEGLATMKAGGVRRLIVPPELGYGNEPREVTFGGATVTIPGGATLIFDVRLRAIQ